MASNPYIGRKGNFNYRKWLRDVDGGYTVDKKLIRYAEQAGFRIGWDRDTTASFRDRYGGANQVGSFRLRNFAMNNRGTLRPEIGLYRIGGSDGGSGSGSGSGGGGGRSGSGSGGGGLGDLAGFFQASSQANAAAVQRALNKMSKVIKKLNKNPAVDVNQIRSDITKELGGNYNQRLQEMQATFTSQLEAMRSAAGQAAEQYRDRLAASQQQMAQMQKMFQGQLQASEAQRAELEAAFAEQERQTNALRTAFVPELEPTAAAPQLADGRSTEQTRRPRSRNTLSDLSLATNTTGSMGSGSSLAGFLLA